MRLRGSLLAISLVALSPLSVYAQAQSESSRAVSGGGISVSGWSGKIDANEEKNGAKLSDAKLAEDGGALHVTTGPAVTYWNPSNKASGNYTVKATFNEPNT